MTDDVRKLLGGYATGTLSEEEKQLLFDAALKDDDLFAALADEQALKELLDDSAVRAQFLRATDEARFSVVGALRDWFERPKAKALVATGAVLLTVIGLQSVRQQSAPASHEVAVTRPLQEPVAPQAAEVKPEPPKPEAKTKAVRSKPAEADQPSANAVVAPQSAPPPPAAAPAAEVASLRDEARIIAPLRYEILRKEANGEFRAVPHDYEFAEGDVIRILVTSTRAGTIAVSGQGVSLAAGVVAPNRPTPLPSEAGIVVPASTNKLVLSYAQPGLSAADGPPQGFVGGAMSRAKEAPAGATALTLDIPIRHRK